MDKLGAFTQILRKVIQILELQKRQVTELLVRKICAEEGLNREVTETFVATLWCESGMNPDAINHNTDGTTDYGLCQFNSYWYRNVITPEVAVRDPATAVRTMIRAWKNGNAQDWVCLKSGGYKKFLKQ